MSELDEQASSGPGSLEELSTGSHALYYYDSSSEKQSTLFKFVSYRLASSSCFLLYICGKQGVKGIRLSMKDFGIDVATYERSKRLRIADSEEWWFLVSGRRQAFKSIPEIRSQFAQVSSEAAAAANDTLTAVSETDAIVRKGFIENYLEFEAALAQKFLSLQSIIVCAYDKRELGALKNSKSDYPHISKLHNRVVA